KPKAKNFDKYDYYEKSVQCVESDIDFINKFFQKHLKRKAFSLREDFGGTGMLCCDWVKQSPKHIASAVDLDVEPLKIGEERHYLQLSEDQKKRMHFIKDNVLQNETKADCIVAFNFSY